MNSAHIRIAATVGWTLLCFCTMTPIARAMQVDENGGLDSQEPAPASPAKPKWKLTGELRERLEYVRGIGQTSGFNDGYLLSRIRLNFEATPLPWARFFVQVQDSHGPGFRRPAPGNVTNSLDLNQAYVDLDVHNGWTLRVGRQELSYGDERLIGTGPWSNVPRRFDAVRLMRASQRARVDFFAASVVVPRDKHFDQSQTRNRLFGVYASLGDLAGPLTVEPFLFIKSDTRAPARLTVYTPGLRLVGRRRLYDYQMETAIQGGSANGTRIRSWAGNWLIGRTLSERTRSPRFNVEYNVASGDDDPDDRRLATFDQLFPTNHRRYGIADQTGWRNIHNLKAGVDWRPVKRLTLTLDHHNFWLTTVRDGLYAASGQIVARNANASSRSVGNEVDLYGNLRWTDRFQLAFGYSHLFAGQFLRESTPGSGLTSVYLMGTYAFR